MSVQGPKNRSIEAIAIGVSAGGFNALQQILPQLPAHFSLPVMIVQHTAANSGQYLVEYLKRICRITVKEMDEKEPILPGYVYLAPPNYHVLVEDDKTFSLSVAERVNYARPSIDVLFESAADVYGPTLAGIILSGAGSDGTLGLKKIKRNGGLTVVQDPESADTDTMPKSALAATAIDYIIPLPDMAAFLIRLGQIPSNI